jgi:ATP-dependent Clp protease protease subunit
MIDRRHLLSAAGALAVTLRPGGVALAQLPTGGQPTAAPRAALTAAWVNFEYAITWERMNTLQDVMTTLVDRKITDITLMLSSSGGDLAAGLSTYNFLRALGIRLTTYNVGNVYSAAMLLYLAGERRVVEPSGQFLIHAPSAGTVIGSLSEAQLGDRVESLKLDTDRLRNLLLERTRLGKEAVQAMTEKTTFLDAAKAAQLGIATEVGHLVRPAAAPLVSISQSTYHGPAPAAAATPTPAQP